MEQRLYFYAKEIKELKSATQTISAKNYPLDIRKVKKQIVVNGCHFKLQC